MPILTSKMLLDLETIAVDLRKDVITMLVEAGSGHSAGSLDMADVFTALYFNVLNIDPKNPQDPSRDRVVLSNGHICPIWYATLAKKGFIPKSELMTLRKLNSRLQGHPHLHSVPGVENSSGPLGQGLSVAAGMALAAKLDGIGYHVYCLGSDGELDEGQIWEAAMFCTHHKLINLTWIIDRNNIQIDGITDDVMSTEPLKDKLESFGWYVIEVNGHDIAEIISACDMAKTITNRPCAIVAHTIPGKGVDFMQYKFEWHGKVPTKLEADKALRELRTLKGHIRSEYD